MKEFDTRQSPFHHVHSALESTEGPTQWVTATPLSLEVKRPKPEADHSATDYRSHD